MGLAQFYFRGQVPLGAVCRVCGGVHVLVTILPPRWPPGPGGLRRAPLIGTPSCSIKSHTPTILPLQKKKKFPFITKSKGEIKLFFFPG